MTIYTCDDRTPYTYLIGWTSLNIWYYGVRYATGCHPNDLMTSYHTSSNLVNQYIQSHGLPDHIEVRRTFDCVERARLWENKVLRRLNASKSNKFLNMTNNISFPIMSGDSNPAKRKDVRAKISVAAANRVYDDEFGEKISQTKTKQNMLKFFREKEYKNPDRYAKDKIPCLERYIEILEDRNSNHRRMIAILREMIYNITNRPKKPYPKNRKSTKRGKMPKESFEWRIGSKYFYNPETLECRIFKKGCEPPTGWLPGLLKETPYNFTSEVRKKLSSATKQYRANESDDVKQRRIEKWRETMKSRGKMK